MISTLALSILRTYKLNDLDLLSSCLEFANMKSLDVFCPATQTEIIDNLTKIMLELEAIIEPIPADFLEDYQEYYLYNEVKTLVYAV
jgi:hypothetical protein